METVSSWGCWLWREPVRKKPMKLQGKPATGLGEAVAGYVAMSKGGSVKLGTWMSRTLAFLIFAR